MNGFLGERPSRITDDPYVSQAERDMQSAGHLAYIEAEIDDLDTQLQAVPLWQPAKSTLAELDWLRQELGRLEASWGKKLVVAIVGPSGAGKSTLLNALAGRELSPTGFERPTTHQVVAYAAAQTDLDGLVAALGSENVGVELAASPSGLGQGEAGVEHPLAHLVLVDTPDTNTLPENQALLARLLAHVDVMLAVFPAQNPKLRDNLAFLAPFVERLPLSPDEDGREGEHVAAVVAVLNMVDRVPLQELQEEILPDFKRELSQAWQREPGRVYLVSAAASRAREPQAPIRFPRDEAPLHGLNEFEELRQWLFERLNRAEQVRDQRLTRAEHLLLTVRRHLAERLDGLADERAEAESLLTSLHERARRTLGDAARVGQGGGSQALQVELYGALARRWWGPIGWAVAAWAIVLRLVQGMARLTGRAPARGQAWEDAHIQDLASGAAALLPSLADLYAAHWPPVADALVRAGFSGSVRELLSEADLRERSRAALERCAELLREQVLRWTDHLAAWPVQLLFNAPVLGLVGWIVYEAVGGFLGAAASDVARYLPADYFRQAGIAVAAVWLLSFALLQVVCSLLLRVGLRRRLMHTCAETLAKALLGEPEDQLRRLASLGRSLSR